jgi:hypothetical protein
VKLHSPRNNVYGFILRGESLKILQKSKEEIFVVVLNGNIEYEVEGKFFERLLYVGIEDVVEVKLTSFFIVLVDKTPFSAEIAIEVSLFVGCHLAEIVRRQ